MHIAWIVYDGLGVRTGGTLYDARVVEGLRARGDRVDVVALPSPGRLCRSFELARRLRRIGAAVVVGDELCFRELGPAFARSRGDRRRKTVLLVHHLTAWEAELPWRTRLAARVLESVALRTADVVVATSGVTARRLGVPAHVARPGCDRLPRRERRTSAIPTLLFVGTISARKRIAELCRAFGDADAKLLLAGSTTREAAYARGVMTFASDRIAFLGERDDDELAELYAAADALVMPSSLEGFGIAAVEAIHAGLPVIAARSSGLVEALAPAAGACLFVDDDASLARAIARVTTDRALRDRLQRAALEAAPTLGTWDDTVTAFRAALG